MKSTDISKHVADNTTYQEPTLDIVRFLSADILTTSGNVDKNQGEWDAMNIDVENEEGKPII